MPSELLVERVVGRRMDPETGAIYHLKYKPPPAEVQHRLVQRSDDTEEKVRSPHTGLCLLGRAELHLCLTIRIADNSSPGAAYSVCCQLCQLLLLLLAVEESQWGNILEPR